jgi:hypothetical protein
MSDSVGGTWSSASIDAVFDDGGCVCALGSDDAETEDVVNFFLVFLLAHTRFKDSVELNNVQKLSCCGLKWDGLEFGLWMSWTRVTETQFTLCN